jgi:hypothetical protein
MGGAITRAMGRGAVSSMRASPTHFLFFLHRGGNDHSRRGTMPGRE